MECGKNDIQPKTLLEAIHGVTRFCAGAKQTRPEVTVHTNLAARESSRPALRIKDPNPKQTDITAPRSKQRPSAAIKFAPDKDSKPFRDRDAPTGDVKFTGKCYNCGKVGHLSKDCRSRPNQSHTPADHTSMYSANAPPYSSQSAPIQGANNLFCTFGFMFDAPEKSQDHSAHVATHHLFSGVCRNPPDQLQQSTDAIFDTGATGTIIANASILRDITPCSPTTYRGLHGDLIVTKSGTLGDIGTVHFDSRATTSIISASECLRNGHEWEFLRGNNVNEDIFLLHAGQSTYKFSYRNGLYIADLSADPTVRLTSSPAILLATAAQNEELFTKREVERSIAARKLQASRGYPPDGKLNHALQSGTFLHCDVLPQDVERATVMWGPAVAALLSPNLYPHLNKHLKRYGVPQLNICTQTSCL